MEDIKKAIEEGAKRHAQMTSYLSDFPHCERSESNGFIKGANFILSKWQDSERWRKVEKELPEIKEKVLIKVEGNESVVFGKLSQYEDEFTFYCEEYDEFICLDEIEGWKPIH